MSQIVLKDIDKFYGSNHVLKKLNLTVENGEFMTLLGPSGCGKTTTLRVIAGLEKPQNGTIEMDNHLVVNAKELYFEDPGKRGIFLFRAISADRIHADPFGNSGRKSGNCVGNAGLLWCGSNRGGHRNFLGAI